MAGQVFREDVLRLQSSGAQVVEVLPHADYRERHIAGAVSLPLEELNERSAEMLDRSRPVVTYCFDFQCDLSPRAAARLEGLGFEQVYDYEGGKMDWLAFGLPVEGTDAGEPTIGAIARGDAPTCRLTDLLSDLSARMADGWSWCAVTTDDHIVLGRVTRRQVDERPEATAAEVMDPAPVTYRQGMPARELVDVMTKGSIESAYVTDSDGRLVGIVGRHSLERALSG